MKRIFLDSSVLFTAVNSPSGGSSKLFTFPQITLVASPVVLAEVERNVRKKLQIYHIERMFFLVKQLVIVDQVPDKQHIATARKIIVEKDAVILSEAKMSNYFALASLDSRHFFTEKVRKFLKPTLVLTPKEILEEWFGR